ncbi:MAG TPA: holo-ACP synthase [Acidimicrobiales bacterium]
MTRTPSADLAAGAAGRLVGTVGGSVVGVGIDAVDIDRLRTMLGRRHHLAERLFTPEERAYAALAPDPVPRLATRFATKEAVMKALGVGLGAFGFHDVEVVRDGLDAPRLALHRTAADLARAAGAVRWHLSLTHTDAVALALVVADGHPASGPPGGSDGGVS